MLIFMDEFLMRHEMLKSMMVKARVSLLRNQRQTRLSVRGVVIGKVDDLKS